MERVRPVRPEYAKPGIKATDVRERFLSKITIAENGCWEWTASCFQSGYAQFWHDGTNRKASRVSYELFIGEIPGGLMICHECDNKGCVNPDHLWAGTQSDNIKDAVKKGRHKSNWPKDGGGFRGWSHSEETKARIALKKLGNTCASGKRSPEFREKMRKSTLAVWERRRLNG